MIAIIDLKISNIRSVLNALLFLNQEIIMTCNRNEIVAADFVVLPGVGTFKAGMQALDCMGLRTVLTDVIEAGTPVLGICLGMQLLCNTSEESPGCAGLGVFKTSVEKLKYSAEIRIPHMNWTTSQSVGTYFESFDNSQFYFSHGFAVSNTGLLDDRLICQYGNNHFVSAIKKRNVVGCQFHPEKSRNAGLSFLSHFLTSIKEPV